MKKIYLLVIKAFIRPFIVTFFIVMFILLMLFLFKYIDDLIGKGFEWYVILQLLMYASATNVAMALPLAVLLSSIMTFGSLGENYELVAIKAAGISLQKAMYPLIITIGLISAGAFVFSDYMLPVANLKMGSLLYDVRNQKAAFLIDEGVFNNSIVGYTIRVKNKAEDGQTLHNVMIYENNTPSGITSVLLADEGKMYRLPDDSYMILKLRNGVRYEENQGKSASTYNPRQVFTRFIFKETEQKFNLNGFKMNRTDENLFKGNYAMLNLKQLKYYKDSVQKKVDSTGRNGYKLINTYLNQYLVIKGYKNIKPVIKSYKKSIIELIPLSERLESVQNAKDEITTIKEQTETNFVNQKDYIDRVHGFMIEYNRKFTLSFSCILLFFIGAPLGAIIRKGGLGLPVVVCIIFFLIYHIISTIGEKYVKEGDLSPVVGMWMAIVVLTPLAAFLTYKATVDSKIFDFDYYKQKLLKLIPLKKLSKK